MKYVKAGAGALGLALLLWLAFGRGQGLQETQDRQARSLALAAAAPEKISARYVLAQARYAAAAPGGAPGAGGLGALAENLKARGWSADAGGEALPMAWCATTGKGAFFRHGWVWVGNRDAKTLKSIWYEPDLKADGKLEWSLDGTQLRLRADGWRHWLNLDLELN